MNQLSHLNIHAVIPSSSVNGPGERTVIFFQGCSMNCPGCFNPATHSPEEGAVTATAPEVLDEYLPEDVEGITVSGGEPFEQPRGLRELLAEAAGRGLSTVVYTGNRYEEIEKDPEGSRCLGLIDVLVDGSYEEALKEPATLARGSTNQRIILLTDRYTEEDFVMPGKVEVIIASDGTVRETGFGRVPMEPEKT